MKRFIFRLGCIVGIYALASCGSNRAAIAEPKQPPSEPSEITEKEVIAKAQPIDPHKREAYSLRNVFLTKDNSNSKTGVVGRLAVKLGDKTVPINTRFKEGDLIKFEISSSADGWIYIFHQAPKGDMSLLWPTKDNTRSDNFVTRHQPVVVPKKYSIEFNHETGDEKFYVTIVPEPKKPVLETKTSDENKTANLVTKDLEPKDPKKNKMQRISKNPKDGDRFTATEEPSTMGKNEGSDVQYQIAIRGIDGILTRSVRLVPDEDDVNLYFALERQNGEDVAAVEFKLIHR